MIEFQVRFDPWAPPTGTFRSGYIMGKLGLNFVARARVESSSIPGPTLGLVFNTRKEEFAARITQELWDDMTVQFDSGALSRALRNQSGTDPKSYFASVFQSLKFGHSINSGNPIVPSMISIRGDPDLCFIEIEFGGNTVNLHMRSREFNIGGEVFTVTVRGQGTIRARMNLTPQAYAHFGQHIAGPVLQAMAVQLGYETSAAMFSAMAIPAASLTIGAAVSAGIMYGLEFCSQASIEENRRSQMLRQYAHGYVEVLYVRSGTAYASADFERAITPDTSVVRPGRNNEMSDARMAGVQTALSVVTRAGRGSIGQIAVRRQLFERINFNGSPEQEFTGRTSQEIVPVINAMVEYYENHPLNINPMSKENKNE